MGARRRSGSRRGGRGAAPATPGAPVGVAGLVGLVALALLVAVAALPADDPLHPTARAARAATGLAGLTVPDGVVSEVGLARVAGIWRSWLVLRPPHPAPGVPLLVGLHGRNATPAEEVDRDGLLPLVAAGRAVLAYPTGYDQAWDVDTGACCGAAGSPDVPVDDVAFVATVAARVRGALRLTGPAALVGFSNGGRLVLDVACRDPGAWAALVAVAAAPDVDCDGAPPVPLLAVVDADDPELPVHEAPRPAPQVLAGIEAAWTARDGCPGPPERLVAGGVEVHRWDACRGAPLETVLYPSGAHDWPQPGPTDPGAAPRVWAFLQRVLPAG